MITSDNVGLDYAINLKIRCVTSQALHVSRTTIGLFSLNTEILFYYVQPMIACLLFTGWLLVGKVFPGMLSDIIKNGMFASS
jgi:hypothetical protein